jgi:CheY-like chemotaxis protein
MTDNKSLRILVVDDEATVLKNIASALGLRLAFRH